MSLARYAAKLAALLGSDGKIPAAALALDAAVPAGTMIFHSSNVAPTGYLKANGASVSRTTYAALFAAIGTLYGNGDGSTTFTLPDMRGEFPRGWDDARGIDSSRAIGSYQGATTIRELVDAYGAAPNLITVSAWNTDGSETISSRAAAPQPSPSGGLDNSKYYSTTMQTNNGSGDNGGFKVRPRNLALLACIKY